ncbi:ATPase [Roseisolibacter agri]|uniref:ATPase n=1 Tax=Roseisolibacter agri TaxID=2014610 RepID=A0AA37V0X0_9BACT|nr:ATPase [Roseisolibacter agri]
MLWTLPALWSAYRAFVVDRPRNAGPWIPVGVVPQTGAWYLLLLVAPLLVIAARRLRLTSRIGRREVAYHLVLLGAISVAHAAVYEALLRAVVARPLPYSFLEGLPRAATVEVHLNVLFYLGVLIAAVALDLQQQARDRERRSLELEAQLAQAQIMALRMQLNPHFLFNTLNTIAMLVRESDNDRAVQMLAGLGSLLRHVLEDIGRQQVPLSDELEFVQRYLAIEGLRFEDRLRVSIEVEPGLFDAQVPNLILQPLVENAIRHGIARRAAAGDLRITATRDHDRILLSVRDDGPGLGGDAAADGKVGVGLENTRVRLHRLYGAAGQLKVADADGGGVMAVASFPLRSAPCAVTVGARA